VNASVEAAVASAFREEAGGITASLVRQLGDFDLAEECVQEALVSALERWPRDGVPDRPGAWLTTTARNRALDRLRRARRLREKLPLLERPVPAAREALGDDRLALLFTCCHPALAAPAQIALTLRAVAGLTTVQIARAFLQPEATVAQRISRAKRKVVEAGIPFAVPPPDALGERLDAVLTVVYLLFNEGYLTTLGPAPLRRDLVDEAEWLASLIVRLLPAEPEPLGLLALIRLHRARLAARVDAGGGLVRLQHQDRSLYDRAAIEQAAAMVVEASQRLRPGRFQLEAAIAALHAEAPSFHETDWEQILLLYDALARHQPTPVVRLNRAIALSRVAGPRPAIAEIDALAPALDRYHLFHAARAELLRELGREEEAAAANEAALALAANEAERTLLRGRLGSRS
jgi:RNA polymerase sigma-70 factor (ECF subfamily)